MHAILNRKSIIKGVGIEINVSIKMQKVINMMNSNQWLNQSDSRLIRKTKFEKSVVSATVGTRFSKISQLKTIVSKL